MADPRDPIYNAFREKLEPTKIENELWNLPPDSVFTNAMDEVNSKKANRRPILIPWLIGTFFLVAIGLGFILFSSSEGSENVKPSSAVASLVDQTLVNDKNSPILNNIIKEPSQGLSHSKKEIPSAKATPLTASRGSQNQIYNPQTPSKISSALSPITIDSSDETNAIDLVEKSETQKKDREVLEHHLLAKISLGALPNPEVKAVKINMTPKISETHNSNWSIKILSGITLSNLVMTNIDKNAPFDLYGYEKYNLSGPNISVSLERNLSKKLNVGLSLSFNKIKNKSRLEQSMLYDKVNENSTTAGNVAYDTQVAYETPVGLFSQTLAFSALENQFQNADQLEMQTDFEQIFDLLSIGLYAQYTFLDKEKWSLFSELGLQYNQILRSKSAYNTTLLFKDQVFYEEVSRTAPEMKSLVSNYTSVTFGLGLNYQVNDRMHFVVQSSFDTSLRSIRDSGDIVQPKTYVRSIKIGLGLKHNF